MAWVLKIAAVAVCLFVGANIWDDILTNGTGRIKRQELRALREISDEWKRRR